MDLYFYNTLTKRKDLFKPINPGEIRIYSCGPTVYKDATIGNMRTNIFQDVLRRVLRYNGYKIKHAMNITDVGHLVSDGDEGEDKMLKSAREEHKTPLQIAEHYTKLFFDDLKSLNIETPEIVCKATDHIKEMLEYVEKLVENGYAYETSTAIYFDVSKLDKYPILTNIDVENQKAGARVDVDPEKRNPYDFALWIKAKPNHIMKWESPWGLSYPGWHIECSGISLKYLGEFLDIHCGGVDNIFPHHTNEIAQSESYIGHKWCNFWVHSEHLNDETGKMSKSKGEFLTVSLLKEKGYNPLAYRLFCLQSHYRKTLLFSYDVLNQVQSVYDKLIRRIQNISEDGSVSMDAVAAYKEKFIECITNDMNTASSLTVLYDVLKDKNINGSTKLYLVKDFDKVLSLNLITNNSVVSNELDCYIEEMIAKRNEAKKNKDFCLADAIRNELLDKGIVLMDTREGTKYELR